MSVELDAVLDELVAADVLVEHDQDEDFELGPRFVRERERQRAELDEAGDAFERYASTLDVDRKELDGATVAGALAIQELATDIDDRTAIIAADAIGRLTDDVPLEGAPDGFAPIRPDEVAAFVDQYDGAVVFFWGDDCEPCDRMREEFEGLVERGMIPDELGLAAVYLGREADIDSETIDLIAEEWMVTVVPTTLFFLHGRIDSRYYGWKPKDALDHEIEILTGYVRGEEVPVEGVTSDEIESIEDVDAREIEGTGGPVPSGVSGPAPEYDDIGQLAETFSDVREYIEEMTAEGENITFEDGDVEELEETLGEVERPETMWEGDDERETE